MDPHPHSNQPVLTAGVPVERARLVVIAIHGRGAGPRDILTLVPALDVDDVAYLAPAAAGNTWYPYSFLTDMSKNEPHLSSALRRIGEVIADLAARGVAKERVALLGFSQGACLSSEFAVRNAGRYAGVIAFSGGLIGPPGTEWKYPGAFDGTPVFFGCSDVDAHIPKGRVDESAAVLERMGARVTERIYPGMGHTINEEEIDLARGILQGKG